jgi:hypothetical protein
MAIFQGGVIKANLDPKEKKDGNFYFVGDIRIVSI